MAAHETGTAANHYGDGTKDIFVSTTATFLFGFSADTVTEPTDWHPYHYTRTNDDNQVIPCSQFGVFWYKTWQVTAKLSITESAV